MRHAIFVMMGLCLGMQAFAQGFPTPPREIEIRVNRTFSVPVARNPYGPVNVLVMNGRMLNADDLSWREHDDSQQFNRCYISIENPRAIRGTLRVRPHVMRLRFSGDSGGPEGYTSFSYQMPFEWSLDDHPEQIVGINCVAANHASLGAIIDEINGILHPVLPGTARVLQW
jgi:hypothetical protein